MKNESLIRNNLYYNKTNACIGFCCLCEEYRKKRCDGYLKTISDNKGNILYQFPLPVDYEYFNEEYLTEKELGYRYNTEKLLEDFFKKMKEIEYIKKSEVFETLKNKYNLNVSERNLRFYVLKEIISPPVVSRILGISGSVSLYKKSTPEIIFLVKWLQKVKGRYPLEKIAYLFKLLDFYNEAEIKRLAESDGIEDRMDRLDLIYMAYFKALAELDLFEKINMMTDKEIHENSFGKVRKGNDIIDGPMLLLDLSNSNVKSDRILITLAKPIGGKVIFSKKEMTVS